MKAISRLAVRGTFAVAVAAVIAGCGGGGGGDGPGTGTPPQASGPVVLKALSNRADMVSNGDALVEVVLPSGLAANRVTLDLNGVDVTSEFAQRSNGRMMGLVTGLRIGENLLTAKTSGTNSGARLSITNFARVGRISSGNRVRRYIATNRRALLDSRHDDPGDWHHH